MIGRPNLGAASAWRVAGVVGLASFALFALTLCPTVSFGDAGELIGAANSFGVAHPPGYPLYTMMGWAALRVPLGEPALRTNLLSAVFAALASATATWLTLRLTASRAGAVAAGLALAVGSTFWSVATVTEVYTLHVLLLLLLLAGAAVVGDGSTRRERGVGLLVLASALGAGLSHHPTIVVALPAAVLLMLPRSAGADERLRYRWLPDLPASSWLIAALLVLALPTLLYGGMMLRARQHPLANWGRPLNLEALWHHATAVAYRHLDLGWAGLLRGSSWATLGRLVTWETTPIAPLLAIVGLSTVPRRFPAFAAPARLAVMALIVAAAIFGLRFTADDIEVFYIPVFVGLALAAGMGVGRLCRAQGLVLRTVGWAAAVLLVLLPALLHFRSHDLRGFGAAADYGRDILDTLPQDASLFVETDDAFPLVYLTQVLGERPDVRIFHRSGELFDNVVEEMGLPGQRGESWGAYRNRVEQTFIDRELSRPGAAGVFFLGWPGYDAPPQYRMEPVGLLYRVADARATAPDLRALWEGYHEARVREQAIRTGDGFALVAAATYAIARGERAMHDGDVQAAEAEFDAATRLGRWEAPIYNYIGLVWGRFGRFDRAIEMFRRATEAKPTSIKAWNNLAKASFLAGDREEAHRAWNRSLDVLHAQPEVIESLRRLDAPR